MTDECKTVTSEAEILDPLYVKQQQDVAAMRTSLLTFNSGDPASAKNAVAKITAMRFYHQLSRIIRYTDMMDKIEEKLYESIDRSLDRMNSDSPATWMTLLGIQERLQKCMIESQKLLQPYLDLNTLTFVDIPEEGMPKSSFNSKILEPESRDKLRESAQLVLAAIQEGNVSSTDDNSNTEDREGN